MIQLPVLPAHSPPRDGEAPRPVLETLGRLTPGTAEGGACQVPTLSAGQQYRFHFDMRRCIGCRSCEVACNEQNDNPAHISWRRVGELEVGSFPETRRFHLSLACNHCLEPTCLEGCPTVAYTKLSNGVVHHDPETCFGCQYCTWTCPYGAPQYHPERRVVTKCSFCAERLAAGQAPACVSACPTSAIAIEGVDVAAWREGLLETGCAANAPGMPDPRISLTTTRITLPEEVEAGELAPDAKEILPEAPHWPLVSLLVLSQVSVGLVGAGLLASQGSPGGSRLVVVLGWLFGQLALGSSLLHLGRPILAWTAWRGWRTSWLSREAMAFTVYAGASTAAAFGPYLWPEGERLHLLLRLGALASGIVAVFTSIKIYLLPTRPSWNTWRTPSQFFGTSLLAALGGGATVVAGMAPGSGTLRIALCSLAAVVALALAAVTWTLLLPGSRARSKELAGTAQLLSGALRGQLLSRTVSLLAAAALWAAAPGMREGWILATAAGLLALGGEILGRLLFFTSVVPVDIPGSYFTLKRNH